MLPVNYCASFTSLKLYGHVKFSISIMHERQLFSGVTVLKLGNCPLMCTYVITLWTCISCEIRFISELVAIRVTPQATPSRAEWCKRSPKTRGYPPYKILIKHFPSGKARCFIPNKNRSRCGWWRTNSRRPSRADGVERRCRDSTNMNYTFWYLSCEL